MSLTRFLKGSLIILIGVILLLNNLNILEWSVWYNILKLWPLLLISLGISLIFRKRLSWLGPLVILLGIFIGIAVDYTGIDLQLDKNIVTEVETIEREIEMVPEITHEIEQELSTEINSEKDFSESSTDSEEQVDEKLLVSEPTEGINKEIALVPSVQKANLHINYDVGTFILQNKTPLVYQCQVSYRYPEFKPIETYSIFDHEAEILITHKKGIEKRNPKNRIDLQLNTDIVYDIFLETGATSIEYDLSIFKIESLNIKSGASKIYLIIPQYDGKIKIDSGVSKIDIAIPTNVGVTINLETGLSLKNLDEHFKKQDNDKVYITDNYWNAEYKVDIIVKTGISQIKAYYL